MSEPVDPPLLKRAFRKELPLAARIGFALAGAAVGAVVAALPGPVSLTDPLPSILVLLGVTLGVSSGWSP